MRLYRDIYNFFQMTCKVLYPIQILETLDSFKLQPVNLNSLRLTII